MAGRILDNRRSRPDLRTFVRDGRTEALAWIGDPYPTPQDPDCGCHSLGVETRTDGGQIATPPVDLLTAEPMFLTRDGDTRMTDWPLLRKFARFWPKGAAGPPDFPWLADLVTREKAWFWASQFSEQFVDLDVGDTTRVLSFIQRSVTDDDPETAEKKKCCKPKAEPMPRVCNPSWGECKDKCGTSGVWHYDCPTGGGYATCECNDEGGTGGGGFEIVEAEGL